MITESFHSSVLPGSPAPLPTRSMCVCVCLKLCVRLLAPACMSICLTEECVCVCVSSTRLERLDCSEISI